MLSWVFRHRQRLQVIYGRSALPELAGERFAELRPGALPRVGPREALRPGTVAWRGPHLVAVPQPRLV